jgi:hypothetical protein
MDAASFGSLLDALLSPDNAVRTSQEEFYNQLKLQNSKELIGNLVNAIVFESSETRQVMAATLLRNMLIKDQAILGSTLSSSDIDSIRTMLLQALVSSKSLRVSKTIVNVIATAARMPQAWPDLFQCINQLATNVTNNETVHIVLYLLDQLFECVSSHMLEYLTASLSIIVPNLSQSDSAIRLTACSAFSSLLLELPYTKENSEVFAHFKLLLLSLERAILDKKDDDCQQLLSILHTFADAGGKVAIFSNCWSELFTLLLDRLICVDEIFDDSIRITALDLLTSLVTNPLAKFCNNSSTRVRLMTTCMNLLVDIDDDPENVFFTLEETEEGFGDAVDQDDIATFAASCLDTFSNEFKPNEVVKTCLHTSWSLITKRSWKERRAALYIASLITEGAKGEIYPLLSQLVPAILTALNDVNLRVRYSALHCLSVFIHEFSSNEDDDNYTNFQTQFSSTVPTAIMTTMEANSGTPRLLCMAMAALKGFYTNENCAASYCNPYADGIVRFCMNVMVAEVSPLYLNLEATMLLTNIASLCDSSILQVHTDTILTLCESISNVGAYVWRSNTLNIQLSTWKGRCLECFAVTCKKAPYELVKDRMKSLLAVLVAVINMTSPTGEVGLDHTDPLSSYILQTCARMATVMKEEFNCYVPYCIPPLLRTISSEVDLKVIDNPQLVPTGGDCTTQRVYQRGVGELTLLYNNTEFQEKEIACRSLYQYMLDIPQLLAAFTPSIIEALLGVFTSYNDDDLLEVSGAIISEAVEIFYRFPTDTSDHTTLSVVENALQTLTSVLSAMQSKKLHLHDDCVVVSVVVETVSNILQNINDARSGFITASFLPLPKLNEGLERGMTQVLSNECILLMNRVMESTDSASYDIEEREDKQQVLVDIWNHLTIALCLLIKYSRDSILPCAQDSLVPLCFTLLQSNHQNSDHLMSFSFYILTEIIENCTYESIVRLYPSLLGSYFKCVVAKYAVPALTEPCLCAMGALAGVLRTSESVMCSKYILTLLCSLANINFAPYIPATSQAEWAEIHRNLHPIPTLVKLAGKESEVLHDTLLLALLKITLNDSIEEAISSVIKVWIISKLPSHCDLEQARETHRLLIDLAVNRDPRIMSFAGYILGTHSLTHLLTNSHITYLLLPSVGNEHRRLSGGRPSQQLRERGGVLVQPSGVQAHIRPHQGGVSAAKREIKASSLNYELYNKLYAYFLAGFFLGLSSSSSS